MKYEAVIGLEVHVQIKTHSKVFTRVAAGSTLDAVRTIYAHVWGQGEDGQSEESVAAVATKLGIADAGRVLADASIKDVVRANTDEAISLGVFGVPTFSYAGELFWGDDATPFFAAFLADGDMFKREPYARFNGVVAAAKRQTLKREP